MQVPFVDLAAQYDSIGDEIEKAVSQVISDCAFVGGKYVKAFENAFADFCRVKYCVGVGNGTDALYIALRALGIGVGDEVITVANSFIATSEAITMTGAKVVFVDCDPTTYLIDIAKVADAVTPKTKAIIPVHIYGQPADMRKLEQLAKDNNLFIVEDAAQAHWAAIDDELVGGFGDIACFSFYPGKNLGAYGDAGAIVTNNDELASRCRMIANHGRVDKYDHEFEGVNSRMDGIQAAILKTKLAHLESWCIKRAAAAKFYTERLNGSAIITPGVRDDVRHVYHLYVIRVGERDMVQIKMRESGIATGIHYPIALPNLKAYRYLNHQPEDFPVASRNSKEILSLPIFPEISEEQIHYVCDTILNIIS